MSMDKIVSGIREKIELGDGPGVNSIKLREWITTISKISTALFGFLSVVIIISVPIIVSLELMYIVFPFFRSGAEKAIDWMKKHEVKVAKAGKKTIELTLRDARQAVIQAETVKTGKSALLIYLGNKCKSIMFLVFILALVLLGIDTIFNVVANLIEGIITLIRNII